MECSFCGRSFDKGRGLMFVKSNGTVFYFCSRKCKVNFLKLGRNPRKVKWTKKHREFYKKA